MLLKAILFEEQNLKGNKRKQRHPRPRTNKRQHKEKNDMLLKAMLLKTKQQKKTTTSVTILAQALRVFSPSPPEVALAAWWRWTSPNFRHSRTSPNFPSFKDVPEAAGDQGTFRDIPDQGQTKGNTKQTTTCS